MSVSSDKVQIHNWYYLITPTPTLKRDRSCTHVFNIHAGLVLQAISYPRNSWQDGETIGILQGSLLSCSGVPGRHPWPDLALSK